MKWWRKTWVMRLWRWCFLPKFGTECYVLGKEAKMVDIVKALITTNVDKGVEIEYKWKDNTYHTFIADEEADQIGRHQGKALYANNVGTLFAENPKGKPIGTEYLYKILWCDIGMQLISGLEELLAGGSKWRKIIIITLLVAGAFYLWKQGFIGAVLTDIIPTPAPAPVPPPLPPTPPIIIPPAGGG